MYKVKPLPYIYLKKKILALKGYIFLYTTLKKLVCMYSMYEMRRSVCISSVISQSLYFRLYHIEKSDCTLYRRHYVRHFCLCFFSRKLLTFSDISVYQLLFTYSLNVFFKSLNVFQGKFPNLSSNVPFSFIILNM